MLCYYCYCPRWNALERFSQFVRSFFGEVTVGVRGIDERDLSAPTQTAPQWVAFGSDRDYGVDKVSRPPHDDGLGWRHTPSTSKPGIYYVPGTWYLVPDTCDMSTSATYHLLYHTLGGVSLQSTRYVLGPFSSRNFFSKFSSFLFPEKNRKSRKNRKRFQNLEI